ncbi:MAG: hypothetical protein K5779_05660 [Saccharofermentans sp.]|nr:hypothetical protein [Saccharofermentans sp.]
MAIKLLSHLATCTGSPRSLMVTSLRKIAGFKVDITHSGLARFGSGTSAPPWVMLRQKRIARPVD